MPSNPNKLSQFWQELKRRKVLRSLAIYAGSAFIILEAVTIIFPRWGLPDWTIDLVLYLLILGAFINIIVAWIFDITPEGVQKTKPVSEVRESDISTDSNAWKVVSYISLGVIAALIIFNVVPTNKERRPDTIESVVILPFENLTGDDGLDITLSGMHTMLIRDMQRIGGLRTICKTSAISYKNKAKSIHEITSELAVGAAIEPTVMCVGDSICMHVKVITPYPEESTIWMADYIVERSQLPNLWNRITKQITDELMIELSSEEESLLAETRTIDPEAYDAYLKGQYYFEKIDLESMKMAEEYFKIAIEKEPEWAEPYAGLAGVYDLLPMFKIAIEKEPEWAELASLSGVYDLLPTSVTTSLKYKYLNKALELNPNSSEAHFVNALFAFSYEFDWDKGEKEFLKSIELNPNSALCHLKYSHLLMILRRSEESVQQAKLGLELDPRKPMALVFYGDVMVNEGDYQSAIQHFEKALSIDENFGLAAWYLSQAQLDLFYRNGDYEKWIELWEKNRARGIWNEEGITAVLNTFHEEGHIAAIEEMFKMNEKYGDSCYMHDKVKAIRYLKLKDYDKVMDILEKHYEIQTVIAANMAMNMYYNVLKDTPRYIELLKKMNLPHDD